MIKWCHSIPDVAASPSPCPVSVLEASLVTVRVKDATKISSNFMRASSRGLPEEANARGPGPGTVDVPDGPHNDDEEEEEEERGEDAAPEGDSLLAEPPPKDPSDARPEARAEG